MQLVLVEDAKEKETLQKKLYAGIGKVWRKRNDQRRITWTSGSVDNEIYHSGKHYFAPLGLYKKIKSPRYLNWFGAYTDSGNLGISIEINIPVKSDNRVAGFFARDPESGVVYLMHDGGVGGGQPGVGKIAFLTWSNSKLVPVTDSRNADRLGIIISRVDDPASLAHGVARFIGLVRDFKDAVRQGETTTHAAKVAQETYRNYFKEFSGKKKVRMRIRQYEYESRHGDVVHALNEWRQRAVKKGGLEKIVKNAQIDLAVKKGGKLTEVYEVKTSCDRQSIYTAIGQVVVHGSQNKGHCKRCLVLPDEPVVSDVKAALKNEGIDVIKFHLTPKKAVLLDAGGKPL